MIGKRVEDVGDNDVEVSGRMHRAGRFGTEQPGFRRVVASCDLRTNFVKPSGKGCAQAVVSTRHQDTFAVKFRQWFSPGLASEDDFCGLQLKVEPNGPKPFTLYR